MIVTEQTKMNNQKWMWSNLTFQTELDDKIDPDTKWYDKYYKNNEILSNQDY